jgi:hypothetical protein
MRVQYLEVGAGLPAWQVEQAVGAALFLIEPALVEPAEDIVDTENPYQAPVGVLVVGSYEVLAGARRVSTRVSLTPMYDPKSERPKQ